MKAFAVTLALWCALATPAAQAWGPYGHEAVASIAERLLGGSAAQQRIAQLLRPGESLLSASVWADCLKGSFCGPHTAEMEAFLAAHVHHGHYHYTDVAFQETHYREDGQGSHDDDIVHILRQLIGLLQGRADVPNPHHFSQREALLLLVHLVGDLHQPLHVGAAYPDRDGRFGAQRADVPDPLGGSNLLLDESALERASAALIPPRLGAEAPDSDMVRRTRSLHAFWDSTAVDYAMRTIGARAPGHFAELVLASGAKVAPDGGDALDWPLRWADESLAVSKRAMAGVAAGPMQARTSRKGASYGVWNVTLPPDYPATSAAIARQQLTRGGVRLAALLKAIWP